MSHANKCKEKKYMDKIKATKSETVHARTALHMQARRPQTAAWYDPLSSSSFTRTIAIASKVPAPDVSWNSLKTNK